MTFWTDERCNTLRSQWAEQLPVRLIADNMGASKNQIIGKARRLNLPVHPDSFTHPDYVRRADKPRRPRIRTTPGSTKIAILKTRPVPQDAPTSLDITFADLQERHCRFVTTQDTPFLFCGGTKEGGSSYCAFHRGLCHEKARGREDRTRKPYLNPFRRAA